MARRLVNPDFAVDAAMVAAERARMRGEPRPLARPVVIIAGWRSPRMQGFGLADKLGPLTTGRADDFIRIAYPFVGDFERALERVRATLAKSERVGNHTEIDLIGISMGGLVGRLLASRAAEDGLVRVRRLFTIATPHRGAILADWVRPDRAARSMRRGSDLLCGLDECLPRADYELICYSQLRDWWVGAKRTSPEGHGSHWIDTQSPADLVLSHFTSPRRWPIVIDIARRLRGESPLARNASAPPRN